MKKKIVIICGPTAVGKTEYAIRIAQAFDGEIVSADSMQLYKYMDIGSAKPDEKELKEAVHHLVDVIDPREDFTVARYQKMALEAIDDISARGKLPVIAGGTGLYINSIIYDMDFAAPPEEDAALRDELYKTAEEEGPEKLHQMLRELDPAAAERIHPNNVKKVVRAIEGAKLGKPVKDFSKDLKRRDDIDPIMICLTRDRQQLYDRINRRVDLLVEKGLVQEVEGLMRMGLDENNISMKGIGYKEIIDYLENRCSLEEALDTVKKNTRHYAKRQLTWFRKYKDMKWFDISQYENDEKCMEDIVLWLKKTL